MKPENCALDLPENCALDLMKLFSEAETQYSAVVLMTFIALNCVVLIMHARKI